MVFDTEKQKQIILEILDSITLPGKALDELYQFKQQVLAGFIADKKMPALKIGEEGEGK